MSVILSAAAALLWLPRPGCPYPHFSAPTWLLQWDKAWSVPSLHTTTCSLSEKSICSLAAASRLAQVIPKTTSLERTSGCTLHKLNLGLHLRRNRHCGLTLEVQIRCFHSNILAGKWYLYIYIYIFQLLLHWRSRRVLINIAIAFTAGLTMLRSHLCIMVCMCETRGRVKEITCIQTCYYHLKIHANTILYHTVWVQDHMDWNLYSVGPCIQ